MPVAPAMAQNDVIVIKTSRNQASVCVAQAGSGNNATAVLVVEGTLNDVDWIGPLAGVDPTSGTGALVTNLTGANKVMVIQTSAWNSVRLRRTDATGGACSGALDCREF